MARDRDTIEVRELEFDEENIDHLARHRVTPADVFSVLTTAPQFFRNLVGRIGTHVMIGPDEQQRFFYVVLIETGVEGRWRPITGHRYNRRRALKYYELEEPHGRDLFTNR